jgi:hypothetical protein
MLRFFQKMRNCIFKVARGGCFVDLFPDCLMFNLALTDFLQQGAVYFAAACNRAICTG